MDDFSDASPEWSRKLLPKDCSMFSDRDPWFGKFKFVQQLSRYYLTNIQARKLFIIKLEG